MSTWNYRAIATEDAEFGEITYALHEVYYDDQGRIDRWTEQPVTFAADSKVGLLDSLARAMQGAGGRVLWLEGGKLRENDD